jgi:ubiquinone/menaquinone biosynthesis C-methylase UbiE
MQHLGWEVYGIEPNSAAAASAADALRIQPDRLFVGGVEEAEWPANTFHLVTLSHVLEHLPDPQGTLANIYRWLRPDGRVRMWVPNIESAESSAFGKLWFGLDVPRHLIHYSKTTIRRLLEGTGFHIVRIVPECQASSLSGSLSHTGDALRRRRRQYRHSARLYYATMPLASVLLGLGNSASLDVTAVKR